MNELALFDNHGRPTHEALCRRSDPCTSQRAAERAQGFSGKHEGAIYNAICEAGPLGVNFKEIADMTGLEPVAVARRLSSMGARKLIERRLKVDAINFKDYQERNGCAVWWVRK